MTETQTVSSADIRTIIQRIEENLTVEKKKEVKAKCQAIIEEKVDVLESLGIDRSMVKMIVPDLVIALSLLQI